MLQPHVGAGGRRALCSEENGNVGAAAAEDVAQGQGPASGLMYKVNLQGVLLSHGDQPGAGPSQGSDLMRTIREPTTRAMCSAVNRRATQGSFYFFFYLNAALQILLVAETQS